MNVTLYKNTASFDVVDKTDDLTQIGTTTAFNEIGAINILQPQIIMAYDNRTQLLEANYAHIDLFNRYYFIKDLSLNSAMRLEATLEVDPLMSFKDELLELDVCVSRNEFVGSTDMQDSLYPINPDDKEITKIVLPYDDYGELLPLFMIMTM